MNCKKVLVLLALFSILVSSHVFADDVIFTGNGSTGAFSDPNNWSSQTVPTNQDHVILNNTSNQNLIFDIPATIKQITVNDTYQGSIILNANVTVNGQIQLQGGSFILNSYTLTIKGNFEVVSPAVFNAGVSTVVIENKDFEVLETITITGAPSFYNLVLNVNGHVSIASQIICLATFDYVRGYIDNGDLVVKGHVRQHELSAGGTGTLIFSSTENQSLIGSGQRGLGNLPDVEINKPSGVLILQSTVVLGNDWSHLNGEVLFNQSEISFKGGAINFDNNGMELNNLHINVSGKFFITGDLHIKGNLFVESWDSFSGNFYCYGGVLTSVESQTASTGICYIKGSEDQLLKGVGNQANHFIKTVIDKTSGTLYIEGQIDIVGDFTVINGDINPQSSTLKFVQVNCNLNFNGQNLYNLEIDTPGSCTVTGVANIKNSLFLKSFLSLNGGHFKITRDLVLQNTTYLASEKSIFEFTGLHDSLLLVSQGCVFDKSELIVNKSSQNAVTLNGALQINSGKLLVQSGTFSLNGNNISSDICTVDAALTLKGNEIFNCSQFTLNASSSTVTYTDSAVNANFALFPSKEFFNLVLGAGKSHTFTSGLGNKIKINGSFSSLSTVLNKSILRSDVPDTQYYIEAMNGGIFANTIDIKDANASLGAVISAKSSIDSGNNVNIDFTNAPAFAWVGSVDSNWSNPSNWGGGVVPGATSLVLISKVYSNNDLVINTNINVAGINIAGDYTGTITQNENVTITVGNQDFIQNSGIFTGSNGNITINGEFILNGGVFVSTSGTLTSNTNFIGYVFKIAPEAEFSHQQGLVVITGTNHYSISTGGKALYNVSINKCGTCNSSGDMIVEGYLEVLSANVTSMNIILYGDLKGNNTNFGIYYGSQGEIKFAGASNQSITYPGALPNIVFDKTGGVVSFDSSFGASHHITHLNGTIDPKTSTVSMMSGDHFTITTNGMEFYNLSWNKTNTTDAMIANDIVVRNDFTINTAQQINKGNIIVKGNFVTTDPIVTGSSGIIFSGSANQTATLNGNDVPNGLITIGSGHTVTFIGTATLNHSSQNLVVKTGSTLAIGEQGLAVLGKLILEDESVLELPNTAIITTGQSIVGDKSLVKYNPTTNATNDVINLNNFTSKFGNLILDSNDNGDVFQFPNNTTINGNLTLTNANTVVSHLAGTLALNGDLLNNGGSFTSADHVKLIGLNQTITGANTFNDFTKTIQKSAVLTFESNKLTSINGNLTLTGQPFSILRLKSTIPLLNNQINILGSRTIRYVDFKDCENVGNSFEVDTSNIDSGNNINIQFSNQNGNAPITSFVSPYFIEGVCGNAVNNVTVSINNVISQATLFGNENYFANLKLDASAPVSAVVTIYEEIPTVETHNILWKPLILNDKDASSDTITIRVNDSLLWAITGTGTTSTSIDANGDTQSDFTGVENDFYAYQYTVPGVYIAKGYVDGQLIGTHNVIVVDAVFNTNDASAVSYVREYSVEGIKPSVTVANLSIVPLDPAYLSVSVTTNYEQWQKLSINILKRGSPVICARIGEKGPIVAYRALNEFTLETSASNSVYIEQNLREGQLEFTMRPYVPGVILKFNNFAHNTTFLGGANEFTLISNSGALSTLGEGPFFTTIDENTNETIGRFYYKVFVPPNEDRMCHAINAYKNKYNGVNNNQTTLVGYSVSINAEVKTFVLQDVPTCQLNIPEEIDQDGIACISGPDKFITFTWGQSCGNGWEYSIDNQASWQGVAAGIFSARVPVIPGENNFWLRWKGQHANVIPFFYRVNYCPTLTVTSNIDITAIDPLMVGNHVPDIGVYKQIMLDPSGADVHLHTEVAMVYDPNNANIRYVYRGWQGSEGVPKYYGFYNPDFKITKDESLQHKWVRQFKLDIHSPQGKIFGGEEWVDEGRQMTLTMKPVNNYQFMNWSINGVDKTGYSLAFTADSPKTIRAYAEGSAQKINLSRDKIYFINADSQQLKLNLTKAPNNGETVDVVVDKVSDSLLVDFSLNEEQNINNMVLSFNENDWSSPKTLDVFDFKKDIYSSRIATYRATLPDGTFENFVCIYEPREASITINNKNYSVYAGVEFSISETNNTVPDFNHWVAIPSDAAILKNANELNTKVRVLGNVEIKAVKNSEIQAPLSETPRFNLDINDVLANINSVTYSHTPQSTPLISAFRDIEKVTYSWSISNTSFTLAGTELSPRVIKNVADLNLMRQYPRDHFIIVNQIVFDANTNFVPIGTKDAPFMGTVTAKRNCPIIGYNSYYGGLFGYIQDAKIENVVLANISVIGEFNVTNDNRLGDYVGGLVNVNNNSLIKACRIEVGTVAGYGSNIGGLVGFNAGTISESFVKDCAVSTRDYPRLLAQKFYDAPVIYSYFIGGFVGTNHGIIKNCFSHGQMSLHQHTKRYGGFAGQNQSEVLNSYSVVQFSIKGTAVGQPENGNFSGNAEVDYSERKEFMSNFGLFTKCFFDATKITRIGSVIHPIVQNQEGVKSYSNGEINNESLGFLGLSSTYWAKTKDSTEYPYPFFRSDKATIPIPISDIKEFQDIKNDPNLNYYLTNDLDGATLGETYFEPILNFKGTLDGRGFKVKNLRIGKQKNGDKYSKGGIFRRIEGQLNNIDKFRGYTIYNVHFENITVECKGDEAGILAGFAMNAHIENCSVTNSTINNEGKISGGLIGKSNKIVLINCLANTNIYGQNFSGGLVGIAENTKVTNSIAFGDLNQTKSNANDDYGAIFAKADKASIVFNGIGQDPDYSAVPITLNRNGDYFARKNDARHYGKFMAPNLFTHVQFFEPTIFVGWEFQEGEFPRLRNSLEYLTKNQNVYFEYTNNASETGDNYFVLDAAINAEGDRLVATANFDIEPGVHTFKVRAVDQTDGVRTVGQPNLITYELLPRIPGQNPPPSPEDLLDSDKSPILRNVELYSGNIKLTGKYINYGPSITVKWQNPEDISKIWYSTSAEPNTINEYKLLIGLPTELTFSNLPYKEFYISFITEKVSKYPSDSVQRRWTQAKPAPAKPRNLTVRTTSGILIENQEEISAAGGVIAQWEVGLNGASTTDHFEYSLNSNFFTPLVAGDQDLNLSSIPDGRNVLSIRAVNNTTGPGEPEVFVWTSKAVRVPKPARIRAFNLGSSTISLIRDKRTSQATTQLPNPNFDMVKTTFQNITQKELIEYTNNSFNQGATIFGINSTLKFFWDIPAPNLELGQLFEVVSFEASLDDGQWVNVALNPLTGNEINSPRPTGPFILFNNASLEDGAHQLKVRSVGFNNEKSEVSVFNWYFYKNALLKNVYEFSTFPQTYAYVGEWYQYKPKIYKDEHLESKSFTVTVPEFPSIWMKLEGATNIGTPADLILQEGRSLIGTPIDTGEFDVSIKLRNNTDQIDSFQNFKIKVVNPGDPVMICGLYITELRPSGSYSLNLSQLLVLGSNDNFENYEYTVLESNQGGAKIEGDAVIFSPEQNAHGDYVLKVIAKKKNTTITTNEAFLYLSIRTDDDLLISKGTDFILPFNRNGDEFDQGWMNDIDTAKGQNNSAFDNYHQSINGNYSLTSKGQFYIHEVDLAVNGPAPLVFERAYVHELENEKEIGSFDRGQFHSDGRVKPNIETSFASGWYHNYGSFIKRHKVDSDNFHVSGGNLSHKPTSRMAYILNANGDRNLDNNQMPIRVNLDSWMIQQSNTLNTLKTNIQKELDRPSPNHSSITQMNNQVEDINNSIKNTTSNWWQNPEFESNDVPIDVSANFAFDGNTILSSVKNQNNTTTLTVGYVDESGVGGFFDIGYDRDSNQQIIGASLSISQDGNSLQLGTSNNGISISVGHQFESGMYIRASATLGDQPFIGVSVGYTHGPHTVQVNVGYSPNSLTVVPVSVSYTYNGWGVTVTPYFPWVVPSIPFTEMFGGGKKDPMNYVDHIKFFDLRNLGQPTSRFVKIYVKDPTYQGQAGELKYILNEDKKEFFILNSDGTFSLYDKYGMTYVFNRYSSDTNLYPLVKIYDDFGYDTFIEHEPVNTGKLPIVKKVFNNVGQFINFQNTNGKLTAITDNFGRTVQYQYYTINEIKEAYELQEYPQDWLEAYVAMRPTPLKSVVDPMGHAKTYVVSSNIRLLTNINGDIRVKGSVGYISKVINELGETEIEIERGTKVRFNDYIKYGKGEDKISNWAKAIPASIGNPNYEDRFKVANENELSYIKIKRSAGFITEATFDKDTPNDGKFKIRNRYKNTNLIKAVDKAGFKTSYKYDDFNNVKEARKKKLTSYEGSSEDWDDVYWPDETDDIVNKFIYTNNGRYLRESTNSNSETTFFYYDFDEEIYGDLNGNGVIDQIRNQLIRTVLPAVDLDHDGTKETTPVMTYEYSNFGVVSEISADGTLVITQYYNEGLSKNQGKIRKKIVDPNGLNLQTSFEYDNYGFVSAIIDPKGNRTEFENDLFGRVIKKYEPYVYSNSTNRIYTENTYDAAGNLTNTKTRHLNHLGEAIGATGFITLSTQYQNSRVGTSSVSVNDTTQLVSRITEYDGYNRVLNSNNPKGNISQNQFALDGRLTLSKIGVGTDVEIHSQPDYNFINQPLGNYTPYYLVDGTSQRKFLSFNIYDEFGRLKIVQDQIETSYTELITPAEADYKPANINSPTPVFEKFKLYSQTGTGNRAINVYEGDLLKKVEKWDVNNRLLQSSENFYDTHNRVIKTTVTTYTYANGFQEVESALSSETFYDIAGRVVKTINPYGAISIGKFDTIGRSIGSKTYKNQAAFNNNQAEVETTLVLDNAGLVELSTIKEFNHVTQLYEERSQSFEYDSLGRVTKTIDPNGYITQSFYNSVNQVEKVIDAEGNVTRNEHDHLGNVVKAIQEYRDANGDYLKQAIITNVFENGNELKQYIDDAGNITEYGYNIHSQLESTKLPGNDNLIYTQKYNAHGQVTIATMPDGTVVNNVYNDDTQLESVSVTKGTNVSANYGADYYFYEYNPLKQLQQVTCKKGGALGTQISQLGYLYDSSGRVTHETQKHGSLPAKTIQSKFFDALNKNQLEHPSGTVIEYRRNELGQLHQIAKNNVVVKENTFVGGKQARIQRGPLTQSLVYGNGNEMLSSK